MQKLYKQWAHVKIIQKIKDAIFQNNNLKTIVEDVLQEIYITLKYLSIYIYLCIKHISYPCPLLFKRKNTDAESRPQFEFHSKNYAMAFQ